MSRVICAVCDPITKPCALVPAVAATGHGIPEELLSEVFRQFKAAFALPQGVLIEGDTGDVIGKEPGYAERMSAL